MKLIDIVLSKRHRAVLDKAAHLVRRAETHHVHLLSFADRLNRLAADTMPTVVGEMMP